MEIQFDTSGFDAQIKAMTNKLQMVDSNAQAVAKDIITVVTDKLLEETQKRTPIDEGILTASIERKVVMDGQYMDDVTGYVYIPYNSGAADYAVVRHEEDYKLGAKSIAKQAATGVTVGKKYIERALEENTAAFSTYIIARLKKALS